MEHLFNNRPDLQLLSTMTSVQGLELALTHQPALILLDINLPDMNGYEVMERLQANDLTKQIPVVVVSANAMPADQDKGAAAGFFSYITKPIEVNELMTTVDRAIATYNGTSDRSASVKIKAEPPLLAAKKNSNKSH